MLTRRKLEMLLERELVAQLRVVPVPFEDKWCVDALVRTPFEPGSTTDTLAERDASQENRRLHTFDSIDDAARFLKSVGVMVFTVDLADVPISESLSAQGRDVLETTQRIWMDETEHAKTPPHAAVA